MNMKILNMIENIYMIDSKKMLLCYENTWVVLIEDGKCSMHFQTKKIIIIVKFKQCVKQSKYSSAKEHILWMVPI